MNIKSQNEIETNKIYLKFYLSIVFLSLYISFIFYPTSYPILGYLTGPGRFADWWNTLDFLKDYPNNPHYMCTIPWVFAIVLKSGDAFFGALIFYCVYILIFMWIMLFPFKYLSSLYGNFYSGIILFGYPIIFGFWRGNSDLFIYGLMLSAYFYKKFGSSKISLIYTGLAIMFKPYQIFYLMCYKVNILKNNIYLIFLGLFISIVLIYLGDNNFFTESWKYLFSCSSWYNQNYAIGDAGILHNNSLMALLKITILVLFRDTVNNLIYLNFLKIYLSIWPFLLAIIFVFSRKYFTIFKNDHDHFSSSFFLLCLLVSVMSPVTPDYRLFFINICLVILILNSVLIFLSKKIILLLIILILIPKHYFWYNIQEINFIINGLINALLLTFLYLYILFSNIFKFKR